MDHLEDQYPSLHLQFRLNNHPVDGFLMGSVSDWTFRSSSPAFLKILPSGVFHKYMLWIGSVPRPVHRIYNAINEAALRAGYDMTEREEYA